MWRQGAEASLPRNGGSLRQHHQNGRRRALGGAVAGVNHATFLGQVEIAMQNGASGVIAGRSLWKDCISLDRDIQRERLKTIAVPRLREIQAVIGHYRQKAAA